MTVRAAEIGDAAVIAPLHHDAFADSPWDTAYWQNLLSRRTTLAMVAERENRLAAFCVFQIIADEAEVLTIGVAADQRRHGLGRALFSSMIEAARAREVGHIFLEVATDNEPARRLYDEFNFVPLRERRDYYARGRHAVQMGLSLGSTF
ncbi:ribosomal protein S18-alanine N-acetyltransferase [Parvularcula sp. LCG005]|uniref:ribosomal protein S18-alanine N-acetyltransferase n=1 Tax=Parvularcula sp. LCG005 TaxID=3078805 RepID=UPI002942D6C1|nr:ribosomal protein S18-alanine N-acetyltransferase [Parvularcula sp. LCG005]WOI53146.1 ribosomal protein S18-alanine N-acetyltransferase [Parvularcula sp. LCG005]